MLAKEDIKKVMEIFRHYGNIEYVLERIMEEIAEMQSMMEKKDAG